MVGLKVISRDPITTFILMKTQNRTKMVENWQAAAMPWGYIDYHMPWYGT